MECSPTGWRRIHRALGLSRIFGFKGIDFLVPRQINFQDIGHGQGEGQIDVGGIEIGLYLNESGTYELVIHDVAESRWSEAMALVDDFCEWWTKIAKSPVVAIHEN